MTHWIILTGGIGSGKSTVAELFFERHHILTIDSDMIARELTVSNGKAIPLLQNEFGNEIIDISGSLNRSYMRDLITHNPTAKLRLERILHPLIHNEIMQQKQNAHSIYAFIAIPLLVEQPQFRTLGERVLLVDCPEDMQIARICSRNQFTLEQAQAALRLQATREQRQAIADDIILNSGSLNDLILQVDKLHQHYVDIFQAA
ncbi:MAG: dephospho-CoA kinase [Neisseriaceae bacterium]|nr:dephospho-CoA kinase [Neisseriaceae bacterium]